MPLKRLSAHLGGIDIWIKREDLTPVAGGGNKLRKLEYLAADAIAKRCDTLVTIGAVQSNHIRQTLGVAASLGMRGSAVAVEEVPGTATDGAGNVQLDRLLGGKLVYQSSNISYGELLSQEVDRQRQQGQSPYPIPAGGSNALGCLGSVDLAAETNRQLADADIKDATILLATGTGGSQAGFISVSSASQAVSRVIGVSVGADQKRQIAKVSRCLGAILAEKQNEERSIEPEIEVFDDYRGPAYGVPDDSTWEAVRLFARLEGIFLDPVYTGKAMAGLLDLVSSGKISKSDRLVFLHSGGVQALPAFKLGKIET